MDTIRLTPHVQKQPVFGLPEWRTPIFGRESEIATLLELVQREDSWLITITGPGGVGKSRLAHEVARRASPQLGGRVAWVPLAPASDTERAAETLAHVLGVSLPGMPPEQAIVQALSDLRALLVLDNLEQIPDFAEFIADLSGRAPELTILATSRAPLHLRGEREVALAPFVTPATDSERTIDEVLAMAAVQLFVSRAQAADSGFALTTRNAEAVAEICRRLDGLPLAIELAAARVRLLPPEAMVPRLARRLDILTSGPRDAPPRQQTLRKTIQWSYDLLEPEAQAVFRSLAVFSGGFSLEAAQAVTQAGEYTLDHLSSLLDHSLLVRLEDPAELRFVMLDTIREFAADMLGVAEEMARARDRHARYFLGLIDTDLERPAQNAAWLDLVDSEIGNLRDALVWLESARCAADLRRLCNLLAHWWLTRGSVTEGNEWTRRADTIAGEVPVPVQMLFDLNLAWMATQVGDFALANETMKRIDFPTLETQSMRLRSTYRMARGALSFYEGDLEAAFASIDEARVLAEEAGTATQNPSIRINLGAIARARGDFDESRIQHSLGLQQTSEPGVRAMHTSALAEIELQTGNLQNAWDYLSATWRECRALGHVLIMISAMATKVELLLKLDRPEEATTLMGAADQLRLSRGWSINTYSESEYFGLLDSCRAQLTPEAFDAAMANGRTLSIGQIDSMMEADPFSATASPLTSAKADSRWMLTARELDVLRQLVEGKSNPEIARALFISERTVQTHVARILQKLGVSSRSAAAVAAVRDHIV